MTAFGFPAIEISGIILWMQKSVSSELCENTKYTCIYVSLNTVYASIWQNKTNHFYLQKKKRKFGLFIFFKPIQK